MTTPAYLTTFVHEVEDLLEKIEGAILELESRPGDAELVNQLFRAFHTLKGSAGVAGVTPIASFTHHVESAMDKVRSGLIGLTPPLVSAVLEAKDHVAALMSAALGHGPCDPAVGTELIARLATLTAGATVAPSAPPVVVRPVAPPASGEPLVDVEYLVVFTPNAEADLEDLGAPAILEELGTLGEVRELAPLPTWKLVVTTPRGENAIRDAFIFIQDRGKLEIDRGLSMFMDDPEPEAASAPQAVAAQVAVAASSSPGASSTAASSASTTAAVAGAKAKRASVDSTVRVSSQRLDQLAKLIGELVITQSRLEQIQGQQAIPELAAPVEAMQRLIGDLRDGVLGLRMVPIGTLFTRFQRLIRDLSSELGKDVELVTVGDETELDKSVIDQLGDALVHILRNSMDHGIESPEVRAAAGKPARGTLKLVAAHQGTHVVLSIIDDGRGIDAAAVRRKAEAQGLIQPGDVLSEQDTFALVMRPGFSTAATITHLSGRGVGMDVVKRSVEDLRGSVSIASKAGEGTEIRLALPLTLAIIDGLLVEIDEDRFVVPLAAVMENLELSESDRTSHNGRNVVAVRGELIPYIRLREVFALDHASEPLEKVVVVAIDGQRVGLVVDRVIGSHQTVIQPLGHFYRGVELFSGTTILGDGRVAMIFDLAGTVRSVERKQPAQPLFS